MEEEQRSPVTIDQESGQSQPKPQSKSRYIQDSASKILHIAQNQGLEALIQEEKPKLSPLDRAIQREKKLKERRQRNLERIIQLSHKSCKDETAGDPNQDWLYRFFEMAQDIHDASMQRLWAQVLKKEVTNPGATSMKALQILKDMTPKEAQILQKAAALGCSFGNDHSQKILVGIHAQNSIFSFGKREQTISVSLGNYQLPYSSLLVLIELGLLHATELESGEIDLSPALPLHYQGKNLLLQPMSKGVHLLYYRFSPTGNELCRLLGNRTNQQYHDQLIAMLGQKFMIQTDVNSTVHHAV
ncbi:hypothetical protein VA7868_01202 [Vibrio aerogenes CECT 7868]|uniref:TIGR03899 family protein n=1 Tax=Vibrio aerogenes CECT 7868 TaxID=1216006 RepID=A0A1M5XKG2_9VIBR|nr:TIGR03899 family protein [Vibrio aerogenes]SHI00219.1 hypothetical protein VA7868_01202 [Vibrio aerogenes CECT 7868]